MVIRRKRETDIPEIYEFVRTRLKRYETPGVGRALARPLQPGPTDSADGDSCSVQSGRSGFLQRSLSVGISWRTKVGGASNG